MKHRRKVRRCAAFLLCAVMVAALLLPLPAFAQEEEKVVRVGWHEAPYFYVDQFGRRFGYSYEYQQKVAAYTGWRYEYVEGGWSELLEMLKNGEIDLLANVSYTEERARDFLYASLPMGAEVYYVFVSPDNTEISSEDYSSLDGKTIGVAKNSIQCELFRQWAESHNVRPELVELTSTEEESLHQLGKSLDGFVTMDVNIDPDAAVPLWKIGSSDYYFAVNKERSDLLAELNAAMSRIQDENVYFSQQLSEKYFKSAKANMFLSAEEKAWLVRHGKIRVGYQDNYLAFCAKDPETGELTGTLKDYLDYASGAFGNARLEFEAVCYPTASAAMEALQKGEIDCMFPTNLVTSDAELAELCVTPALMKTEMDAVVREDDQKEFIRRDRVTVAVNEGNTNYEMFLKDHFPHWEVKYYPDTPAGLEAIAAGEADCVIISNYRLSNIAKQCKKLNLTTVYTGADMEYYFAVHRGDTQLYSILAKTTAVVPSSTIHAALTYYSAEDAKTDFMEILRENLPVVLLGIVSVLCLILFLLLRSLRAEKKATEEERMIRDLNKQIYVDALTHVRNKGGYEEFMQKLQLRLDQGETLGLAIGVFDCDNLKGINDLYGHDKGDLYLRTSSKLICRVFRNSPVFRVGGDEFVVILLGLDFENRAALLSQFEEEQGTLGVSAQNEWERVSVSSGLATYDPLLDPTLKDLAQRADQMMYENKRARKEARA